jgi:hypothetical protein
MRALLFALLAAAGTAHADVIGVSPTGFVTRFQRDVQATPAQAFDAIGRLPQWWNPQHSYSGKSANLRFALKAGDCFCEEWDGSSIEHARVLLVMRNALVRLEGGLGPLQELGVNGILTLSTGVEGGKTFVRLLYRVQGSPEGGFEKLAPIVDRVMGEQFNRWSAHVESTAKN